MVQIVKRETFCEKFYEFSKHSQRIILSTISTSEGNNDNNN